MMKTEFTLIEAAAGGRPRVAGLAYSGGKMTLPGWRYPVVVALAGMDIPASVPLLTNHENRTDARVGMVKASIKGNALEIEGEIVSDSAGAADIIAQGKSGADWQLSIGADVRESVLIKADREVNGQMISAPFYLVSKSLLREVSVVAVGADQATRMQVAASFNLTGEVPMHDQNTRSTPPPAGPAADPAQRVEPPAAPDAGVVAAQAVAAERERIAGIQRVCNGEFPEIEREAVNAGWSYVTSNWQEMAAMQSSSWRP